MTIILKSEARQTKIPNCIVANYRTLHFEDASIEDEENPEYPFVVQPIPLERMVRLNTFWNQQWVLPQQEYTFVKVDQGQGVYVWIDYNNNEVQELNEFEVAQFQDQAEYIKVLLPNQVFVRIRNNKFSQILTLNPQEWINASGFRKLLSVFTTKPLSASIGKSGRTAGFTHHQPIRGRWRRCLGP